MIESASNPSVKLVASLTQRKYRHRHGLLLLEGERSIAEAMRFDSHIKFALYEPRWETSGVVSAMKKRGVTCKVIHPRLIHRVAATEQPQGIIAVAAKPSRPLPAAVDRILIIDRLRDPGNMGTMIRTAAAVDVDGVILSRESVDPTNPKAIRASAGAYFALPIVEQYSAEDINEFCKDAKVILVGADAGGTVNAFGFDWRQPHGLVIGNEADGIDDGIDVGVTVSLPMPGRIESLNAAMAATVLLYEAWRAGSVGSLEI